MPKPAKLSKLGRAACKYARQGFHVFPLKPRGKTPLVEEGFRAATNDVEQVREWWREHPNANIGFAPGPSGYVVLDLDSPKAADMARRLGASAAGTRAVQTGREGGQHLHFRRPSFEIGNRPLDRHIDVRCDKGYVILPPSIHPTGVRYRWLDASRPIADLPPAVARQLRKRQDDGRGDRPGDPLPKLLRKGERNTHLTSLAGTMRRPGMGLEGIRAALQKENESRCVPPLESDEIDRIAASVMRYSPAERSGKGRGRLSLIRLSSVTPKAVNWLWRGYLPLGKLVLLDGFPGQGKSLAMLDIAARGSRNRAMPDGSRSDVGQAWDTLILTYEDDQADTLRPRIDAARGDPARIRVVSGVKYGKGGKTDVPVFPDHVSALERALKKHPATRLVIIDPLVASLSGKVDSHRDQDTRRVTAELARLASRRNVCIAGIRHFRKHTDGNAITAGGGSIGLIGAARVGLIIDRHPSTESPERNDVSVLACSKSNLSKHPPSLAFRKKACTIESRAGALETVRVRWKGDARLTADELLAAREESALDGTHGAVEAMLRELLTSGPVKRKDVVNAARQDGFAMRTVDRVANRIGVTKLAKGFGPNKAASWSLPTKSASNTPIAAIPATKKRGSHGRNADRRKVTDRARRADKEED